MTDFEFQFNYYSESILTALLDDLSLFKAKHIDRDSYESISQIFDQALDVATKFPGAQKLWGKSFSDLLEDLLNSFNKYYESGINEKKAAYSEMRKAKTLVFEKFINEKNYLEKTKKWEEKIQPCFKITDASLVAIHDNWKAFFQNRAEFKNLGKALIKFS